MKFLGIKIKDYIICTIITFIVSFLIFVSLFHTTLFSNVKVLMYRGLIFLLLVAIINLSLGNILKKFFFKNLNGFDIFSIMVMVCSIMMVFFVLVPVTVERSVSVYMLSEMDESGTSFSKEDIEEKFIDTYVKKFGAFDKRFDEQIVTGTINKVDDNKYIINNKGKFIVKMFRFISKIFNTDKKLVYPNMNKK